MKAALLSGAAILTLSFLPFQIESAQAVPVLGPGISRQAVIDDWTDYFFYRLRPELEGRKLGRNEVDYIREWQSLRNAVSSSLEYGYASCRGNPGYRGEWMLNRYDRDSSQLDSPTLDRIADAAFHSRNPELRGRNLSLDERELAEEWNRIRGVVSVLHPCQP